MTWNSLSFYICIRDEHNFMLCFLPSCLHFELHTNLGWLELDANWYRPTTVLFVGWNILFNTILCTLMIAHLIYILLKLDETMCRFILDTYMTKGTWSMYCEITDLYHYSILQCLVAQGFAKQTRCRARLWNRRRTHRRTKSPRTLWNSPWQTVSSTCGREYEDGLASRFYL